MKGERRAKRKEDILFRFALPNRLLSYSKIVKGERKAKGKEEFLFNFVGMGLHI